MKNLLVIFITLFLSNSLSSQTNIKNNFEVCNSDFQFNIKRIYTKEIIKLVVFNRSMSYGYYSNYYTGKNEMINYNYSDSLKVVPYQYVLRYDIHDVNDNVIGSININCRCYDNLLKMDKIEDLDEILKPQMEVIKGKALTLKQVFEIAKAKGYSIDEWDIDYEKKKGSNEYKYFFPKLIWTLKEKLSEEEGGYYKVLQINARNGNVINEYKEYGL